MMYFLFQWENEAFRRKLAQTPTVTFTYSPASVPITLIFSSVVMEFPWFSTEAKPYPFVLHPLPLYLKVWGDYLLPLWLPQHFSLYGIFLLSIPICHYFFWETSLDPLLLLATLPFFPLSFIFEFLSKLFNTLPPLLLTSHFLLNPV